MTALLSWRSLHDPHEVVTWNGFQKVLKELPRGSLREGQRLIFLSSQQRAATLRNLKYNIVKVLLQFLVCYIIPYEFIQCFDAFIENLRIMEIVIKKTIK
ncbi:hypothetical protein ATANTOWER_016852 [Ataeniobius toweri]|uniref:Uncharacterized protein n=1 Tax=Ataeniobius toweri TaxID=208326 RepID=A0ABU7C227_9TELE|nr:hypothetical protein [Ataeniobius toweri]